MENAAQNNNNETHGFRALCKEIGPGIVTGAADDDPSGIATYSQAGAQFGYGTLWSLIFTYPLMLAIQLISAHIGCITGQGIAATAKRVCPHWLVYGIVALMVAANTINIGADFAAMGDALKLVIGGDARLYTVGFGIVSVLLQVFVPYHKYASWLKWLTLVLFVYIIALFTLKLDIAEIARTIIMPGLSFNRDTVLMIVAIFGTTISPYLFFWQASQEVEEIETHENRHALKDAPEESRSQMRRMTFDTVVGMALSNIIALAIMIVTAATLNKNGVMDIQSSAQAAEALRPVAGNFAFFLFATGIIGTGMLAVPVLAGAAAYGVAEAAGWPSSLEAKVAEARGFYFIIVMASVIGIGLTFTPIDPIKMLFWSAVINGIAAVPIMAIMMYVGGHKKLMGDFTLSPALKIGGWTATGVMGAAAALLFILSE